MKTKSLRTTSETLGLVRAVFHRESLRLIASELKSAVLGLDGCAIGAHRVVRACRRSSTASQRNLRPKRAEFVPRVHYGRTPNGPVRANAGRPFQLGASPPTRTTTMDDMTFNIGAGPLRSILDQACEDGGESLNAFTVLSTDLDPYRLAAIQLFDLEARP